MLKTNTWHTVYISIASSKESLVSLKILITGVETHVFIKYKEN